MKKSAETFEVNIHELIEPFVEMLKKQEPSLAKSTDYEIDEMEEGSGTYYIRFFFD